MSDKPSFVMPPMPTLESARLEMESRTIDNNDVLKNLFGTAYPSYLQPSNIALSTTAQTTAQTTARRGPKANTAPKRNAGSRGPSPAENNPSPVPALSVPKQRPATGASLRKRGCNYTGAEVETLLCLCEESLPIGQEWDTLVLDFNELHPTPGRDKDSLKRKFSDYSNAKVPTGNPNCPNEVKTVGIVILDSGILLRT